MKVFWEELVCDCGATMELQPKTIMSCVPKYEYKCPNCGKTEISLERYPKEIYEPAIVTPVKKS